MERLVKDITTKMILCDPVFKNFIATIERTDEKGYPEKPTRGKWNGLPASANFPGGRSNIYYLIQRLREVINPPHAGKKPWGDFLEHDPDNVALQEEITVFDLCFRPPADPVKTWLTLTSSFPEIKEALLKIKLFAEVRDETGVERREIEFIGLILNFLEPIYKTSPETRKMVCGDNGKRIVEKWIDAYYYLGSTNAEGLPRVTYRDEIIGSNWFTFNNPPELLYQKCTQFLDRRDVGYIIGQLREKHGRHPLQEKPIAPPQESDQALFEWAKR